MPTFSDRVAALSIGLDAHRGEFLGIAGLVTGLATTADLLAGAVCLAVSLTLYGLAVYGRRRRDSSRASELDRAEIDFERAADLADFVTALAHDLHLTAPWRITVYEEADGHWVRVHRASNHAPFRRSGRQVLPADQGVLADASRTGVVEPFNGLPDPEVEWDQYVAFQESRRIPPMTTAALTMRSRSYACVVKSVRTLASDMVDVGVVVESEGPAGVRAELVDRHVGSHVIQLLHRLLKLAPKLKQVRADLDDHRRERAAE